MVEDYLDLTPVYDSEPRPEKDWVYIGYNEWGEIVSVIGRKEARLEDLMCGSPCYKLQHKCIRKKDHKGPHSAWSSNLVWT